MQALTRTASYGSWFNFYLCDFDGRVTAPGRAARVNPVGHASRRPTDAEAARHGSPHVARPRCIGAGRPRRSLAGCCWPRSGIDDLPLIGGGDTHTAPRSATPAGWPRATRCASPGSRSARSPTVELARGPAGAVRAGHLPRRRRRARRRHRRHDPHQDRARAEVPRARARRATGWLAEDAEIPLDRTASPFDVMRGGARARRHARADRHRAAGAGVHRARRRRSPTPRPACKASLTGCPGCRRPSPSRDSQLRELLAHAARRDRRAGRSATRSSASCSPTRNLLLAEVQRRRDAIHDLLVATVELSDQLSGLVADNRAHAQPRRCSKLRAVVGVLQRNRTNLEATHRPAWPRSSTRSPT